jgi:hypothetical protein
MCPPQTGYFPLHFTKLHRGDSHTFAKFLLGRMGQQVGNPGGRNCRQVGPLPLKVGRKEKG